MFATLSTSLTNIFDRLRGRGALTEADVDVAMREIRIALLEADVALPVVKDFIAQVKQKAVGQDIIQSITPGQMMVKIVHDQLTDLLGGDGAGLNLAAVPPVNIMMVGLQGSGKTTSTAKIAHFLTTKKRKKVLMVSVDVYRPAAREQLQILGAQINVATVPILEQEMPLDTVQRAQKMARLEGFDVLLIDTAGRLHIDAELMSELQTLHQLLTPMETLFVADAMTGQDAVNSARAFQSHIPLTGVVLTRMDGDMRGGAALSLRHVTQVPLKFIGVGERVDQLEEFHPDRTASRILDMGDVLSLVEKAAENFDQEESEKLAQKMEKGQFDLTDLDKQLSQITKMGGFGSLMSLLPGMGKLKDQLQGSGVNEKTIAHQRAIISSMTQKERRSPGIINGSRRKRIALGSGRTVPEINKLLKQFHDMQDMMKRMNKWGQKGLKRQGLKGLFGR